MLKKRVNDLVSAFCKGVGKRFRKARCEYHNKSDRECRLLREQKMNAFWEKCRCRCFETLYEAITTCLEKFKWKYPTLGLDESQDIDFEKMIGRLKTYGLKQDFTLKGWVRYMNKAVYMEIKGSLVKKGLIPKVNACGTCKHFPGSPPYACRKTGYPRKKGDMTCEEYVQRIGIFISMDSSRQDDNLEPGRLMSEISAARDENTKTLETIIDEKEGTCLISDMRKMLDKRFETATAGSKDKQKYERQHAVLINLLALLSQDISEQDAIKHIANENHTSVKTIQRDIKEIRKFFRKKCPEICE